MWTKIKNRTQICPVQRVHVCQGAHTPAAASSTKGTVSPNLFNFGSNERKRWHFHCKNFIYRVKKHKLNFSTSVWFEWFLSSNFKRENINFSTNNIITTDLNHTKGKCAATFRVLDPHWFNADPDPAFFLIADPDDPVPNPGFWWPKRQKLYKI